MYEIDQPKMADYALSSDENFLRTVCFVLLTIQQRLETVRKSMQNVETLGPSSPYLWGMKGDGYLFTVYRKNSLRTAFKALNCRRADREVAVNLAMTIPGLGLVKAAFLCQILGYSVGCIDSHNLKRFGIKRKDIDINKKATASLRAKKIVRYCDLCDTLGGAEYLWDGWCEYVAERGTNKTLRSAQRVSEEHVRALGLE